MGRSAGVFLRGGSDSPGALAGQHQQEAGAAARATSASAWRFLKETLVTRFCTPEMPGLRGAAPTAVTKDSGHRLTPLSSLRLPHMVLSHRVPGSFL